MSDGHSDALVFFGATGPDITFATGATVLR
jgi:hypothetical protein